MSNKNKTLKDISFSIVILLILIVLFFAQNIIQVNALDVQDDNPMLIMQLMTYDPFPAEPGDYLNVWTKVENRGSEKINDFEMEIVPHYPFSIDGSEVLNKEITDLGPFESKLIKYKIRVDEKALDGTNHLKFRYRYGTNWQEASFPIEIYSINKDLSITSITSNPEKIIPGEASEIKIAFKNNANSMMRYVTLGLELFYPENPAGTSYVELPFTPINGGSEKTIYSIPSGEERTAIFTLMADPDAEAGPYKIPITLTYFDKFGVNHTRTEIIGLVIDSEPDLYVVVDKSDISKKGQSGEVYLKFINKGLSDIKFLNVEIPENENLKVIGSPIQYVGDVDSDDYETLVYRIIPKKEKEGIVEIPLSLEYKDANNNHYEEKISVELFLYSKKERGESDNSGFLVIIVVVVLVIGGTIFYKKWGKKNKN